MDSEAALKRYRDANADGDFEEASAAMRDLATWYLDGGFISSTTITDEEFAILYRHTSKDLLR